MTLRLQHIIPLLLLCLQWTPAEATPEIGSRNSLFNNARNLAHSGEHSQAIAAYDSLLKFYPNDAEGHLGRGLVYAWLANYLHAENDILYVTSHHPQNTDAWSAQTNLYRWWQKPEKALAACNSWGKLEPDNPNVYVACGGALMLQRKFPDARKALNKSLALGGNTEIISRLLAQLNRVSPATKWKASLWYEWKTWQDSDNRNGHQIRAQVQKRFDKGSIAYGIKWLDQYDTNDEGLFLDCYYDLWTRAYTNARFELAAAPDVMPLTDSYLAIYQGLGSYYEMMVSHRHMDFSGNAVNLSTIGAGMFPGQYYLRAQVYIVPKGETYGHGMMFSARRYLGIVDNYVEATIIRYKDYQMVDGGYLGVDPQGWILNINAQKWISKTWGLGLGYGLVLSDESLEPNKNFWRLGLFARW